MNLWPKFVNEWGTDARDHEHEFPCDELVAEPTMTAFRAVDVEAPVAVTYRWLCQMRVAPYSYDKLDNWGRQSPQELIPGLERLELDQRWMQIFKLVGFEPGRSITLLSNGPVFGKVGITYLAVPNDEDRSRIVVKVQCRTPSGLLGRLIGLILPPGDLVMMRRQLLNLASLARRTPLSAVEAGRGTAVPAAA